MAGWLKSMSPGQFWGVMSCVPLTLLLVGLLLQQLSKFLPANVLVLGAVLLLVVVAVRHVPCQRADILYAWLPLTSLVRNPGRTAIGHQGEGQLILDSSDLHS
jgi:hypothetical protein